VADFADRLRAADRGGLAHLWAEQLQLAVTSAAPSAGAADGEDPVAARCTADAVLVDKMPVFISGRQAGR